MTDHCGRFDIVASMQGIGKAIVEELACLGASVLTCSRTPADITACLEVRVCAYRAFRATEPAIGRVSWESRAPMKK